jgi:hypothetical protein
LGFCEVFSLENLTLDFSGIPEKSEWENSQRWKKFGKNREIAWRFSEATDFSVKSLLNSFSIQSMEKFRPKSSKTRRAASCCSSFWL